MAPLVSVVVPTYYRNERLRASLESVRAQTHGATETIVVDDSGEGHAEPVVAEFDATYLPLEENRGVNVARNRGFEVAEGEYVQFLDDDDRLRPTKIERQVDLLEAEPRVGVAYCGREMESGFEEYPDPEVRGDVLEQMLRLDVAPCLTSTLLVDADELAAVHPFPDYRAAADVPIKIELAERVHYEFVDELLVVAGEGEESVGSSWANIGCSWRVLEEYAHLYDAMPRSVRRSAVARIHRKAGRRHLEDRRWSSSAIVAFAKSVYHDPDPDLGAYGELLASVGGAPGRSAAATLADRL